MDYDQSYSFSEDYSLRGGGLRVGPIDEIEDDVAVLRGEFKPKRPLRFGRRQGKRVCDVIWTTLVIPVLVSKRFCTVLEREGFTGWSTYLVAVYDGEGRRLRGYKGLSITGRAGPVDDSRSKKVWRPPYVEGGPRIRRQVGLFFKNDQWDGSDIFLPEGSCWVIVTKQVKDALQGLNIPNVEFRPLSNLERDI